MRHILYVSGTRADYGLMRRTLLAIDQAEGLKLTIAATGMHLMQSRGHTLGEIEKEGFSIVKSEAIFQQDSRTSMGRFVGECMSGLVDICERDSPDVILVLGDRGEMLAGATVGTYLGIPVGHIHGGEVSSTVDESIRHAITKLAHFHLPATQDSADRIQRMGEPSWRIQVVGAPGLDGIGENLLDKETLFEELGWDREKPLALLIQHPVSEEAEEADIQMEVSLEAMLAMELQVVVVYPNADAGGSKMIEKIQAYASHPLLKTFSSLPRSVYLSIMKYANVMVGNSSSGLIEAPSFNLPVVNIGNRQLGRLRGANIIDVPSQKEAIVAGIGKALSDVDFLAALSNSSNPYGDGNSAERIVTHLKNLEINSELLQKQIAY